MLRVENQLEQKHEALIVAASAGDEKTVQDLLLEAAKHKILATLLLMNDSAVLTIALGYNQIRLVNLILVTARTTPGLVEQMMSPVIYETLAALVDKGGIDEAQLLLTEFLTQPTLFNKVFLVICEQLKKTTDDTVFTRVFSFVITQAQQLPLTRLIILLQADNNILLTMLMSVINHPNQIFRHLMASLLQSIHERFQSLLKLMLYSFPKEVMTFNMTAQDHRLPLSDMINQYCSKLDAVNLTAWFLDVFAMISPAVCDACECLLELARKPTVEVTLAKRTTLAKFLPVQRQVLIAYLQTEPSLIVEREMLSALSRNLEQRLGGEVTNALESREGSVRTGEPSRRELIALLAGERQRSGVVASAAEAAADTQRREGEEEHVDKTATAEFGKRC